MSIDKILLAVLLAASAGAQQSVDAVRVVSKTVERRFTLPGEFAPYLAVDLYARVNGFVDKVNVDRGSIVKTGDLLITVVAPELVAQVAEAESKVQAAESQRAEAQAKFVAVQSTYASTKTAAQTPGAVAENELVVMQNSMEAARSLVEAVEGAVRAARASVQSLKDLEAYLTVTAPFDGVITTRFVHPGALVGPAAGSSATPMLRLEENSRLRLVVAVPEADAGGVVNGARVSFTVPAYAGEMFSGVVARISHSLDLKTRTMPVELDVSNANLRLAPGMYAQVQWPVRGARASLLVPPSSIVTTNERQFVIRMNNGVAEWVTVTRGVPAGDLVEVLGPLHAGDLIARRGTDELREGARVQAHVPWLVDHGPRTGSALIP
jgi:RND family efflux transporter MFP subunit